MHATYHTNVCMLPTILMYACTQLDLKKYNNTQATTHTHHTSNYTHTPHKQLHTHHTSNYTHTPHTHTPHKQLHTHTTQATTHTHTTQATTHTHHTSNYTHTAHTHTTQATTHTHHTSNYTHTHHTSKYTHTAHTAHTPHILYTHTPHTAHVLVDERQQSGFRKPCASLLTQLSEHLFCLCHSLVLHRHAI